MLIRKGIQDVLALASSFHQILAAQNPEALGDGGDVLFLGSGKIGNAERPVAEQEEQTEAGNVAESPKDVGGAVESGVEGVRQSAGRIKVLDFGLGSFRQFLPSL